MTKTLNQIIFFSSTKIRIFFSATLGIRIFFLEKNHNPPPPPPPLQVKWSFPTAFNIAIRYIDTVLSINNPNVVNRIPLKYSMELEVNETTEPAFSPHFTGFVAILTRRI